MRQSYNKDDRSDGATSVIPASPSADDAITLGLTRVFTGADSRNRTHDLLITNQLLYQLSYAGATRSAVL